MLKATVRYPREVSSPFRVAFPLGVTVGKWTRAFEQRFPRVELVVRPSDDPLAALTAGEADMVFARDAEPDDERHLIPLYAEDVVAVVHHEHLLTLEETWQLADFDDEPRVTGEPSEALMRRVASGDGVAWVGDFGRRNGRGHRGGARRRTIDGRLLSHTKPPTNPSTDTVTDTATP